MSVLFLSLFGFYTALLAFFIYRYLLKRSSKYVMKKANISAIRWGSQTKPIVGGIVFYFIFLFSLINYFFFQGIESSVNNKLIAILVTVTLSFFMGLADDMINTSPYFKLIIQVICSIILISFGFVIDVSPNNYINYIVTSLWVIGIMNSFNMLDNMDAITAPISITIIFGIFIGVILSHDNTEHFYYFIVLGSAAALISFLYFNWHPAKMYMGDNGSQFLGSFLAILGIIFFWNKNSDPSCYCFNTKQFIAAVLAFLVPLTDTTTVTINRILKGKSPFEGGKDHTTHHLNYLGLNPRKVAILLFSINLISVCMAVYITFFIKNWTMTYFYGFAAFAFLIFISLYSITKISKPKISV